MINKSIEDNKEPYRNKNDVPNPSKPNEMSGIEVTTHLKIFDPNTGNVLVQKRGDT